MQFKKLEDGSCDLIFSDEEIEIINKNKKFSFTAEGLKQFGGELIGMANHFASVFVKQAK
jgi:hypothetical protein